MRAELGTYLAERRALIDAALAGRVPAPGSAAPPVLAGALRHALLAPGKRLRGTLVLAASELVRGAAAPALELACAVEMVHTSSLILDDLPCMDDATLRRGQPALHRVVGDAQAILAAVALLDQAFETIQVSPGLGDRTRREATRRLTEAVGARGLVGGQAADLEATGSSLDLDALEFVHSHKTGALFIAAAELGALTGGARARDRDRLQRYAKNLGLAFQITDDFLDRGGRPDITGKDAGLDRAKTTFVSLCGVEGARRLVDELIDASILALAAYGARARWLTAFAEFVRGRDR